MTTLDALKVADLNLVLNSKSLKKARGYINRVNHAVRRGNTLQADVSGSRLYNVEIDVAEDGIHAVCSCPYNWGGYCKHIGAVLLKWLASPGNFTIELPASTLTTGLIETFPVEPAATAVPKQKPSWLSQPYDERRRQNDKKLDQLLGQYKLQDLRKMAKDKGWAVSGTRKDDIVQQMTAQILQPGNALKSLLSLDAEHLRIFQALGSLADNISYREEHLRAMAKQWGPLTGHKRISTYTNHLCESCLAIPAGYRNSYYHQLAFIPASIWRVLPPLLAERIPETSLPAHQASEVQLAAPRPFLQKSIQALLLLEQSRPLLRTPMPRPRLENFHDFLREWDYVPEEIFQAQRDNKLKGYTNLKLTVPSPEPALPDETIKRLAPIAENEAQLNFIYHLLVTAGLLQPGSPVTVWSEVKERFLYHGEEKQWAIIVRAYFEMLSWSELWLVQAERPSLQLKRVKDMGYYYPKKPADLYKMLALFRIQVLQLLANLPDDRWYSVDDIAQLLHAIWPRFDSLSWTDIRYGPNTQPEWFLADEGRPLDTISKEADWQLAQGAFIRHIIQGPLHWLGLADIAVEHGWLVAFRLHGLNDIFFDKAESLPLANEPAGARGTAVSIQSAVEPVIVENLTIIVDPTVIGAQAHNYLDSIARLETAEPAKFIYQLQAAVVHKTFEDGQTLSQLLGGWERWLDLPMPETIKNRLMNWWNAYGQVRLYQDITVIEFSDEYALAEMKAATSLEKYLVAEISPNLVIIHESAINNLVSELEKAGYTPKQADRV